MLVHPPGGLVGGDELDIELDFASGAHALVTTPGAMRFYRSTGATATQRLRARLDAAREAGAADALLARSAGATAVNDAVVVMRMLAARVRHAVPRRELLRADSPRGRGSPA